MAQHARTCDIEQADNCCRADGPASERRYPGLEESARLFRALGDETRLGILKQLREQGEVCACDFQACCRLAQPTVSHHLKVLRRAGLVRADKRGLWVYYTLNEERLARLRVLVP
jgi:ArsR family transcriptional regulator